MPIITENKRFSVFGAPVSFTSKELMEYKSKGLELTNGMLEFVLMNSGMQSLPDGCTQEHAHRLCIEAIEEYCRITRGCAEALAKEGMG